MIYSVYCFASDRRQHLKLIAPPFSVLGANNNNNNGMNSSQIVRQELRAVVSGRSSSNGAGTPNNGIRTPQSPLSGNPNNNNQNNGLMMQQQQMAGTPLLNSTPELEPSMRFNFDMPQGELSLFEIVINGCGFSECC